MRPSAPEPLYWLTEMRLRKKQRLMLVVLALLLVGGATGLTLAALQDKVAFFVGHPRTSRPAAPRRAGPSASAGWSSQGSVKREGDGDGRFVVTDTAHAVPVTYQGILPDLFREGQGVVAEGQLAPTASSRRRGAGQARRELHAAAKWPRR